MHRRDLDTVAAVFYSFSFQSVIIDMKAMLNNAIKGDYIAAETDPSVSLYNNEMCYSRKHSFWPHGWLLEIPVGRGSQPNVFKKNANQSGIARGVEG